MSQNGFSNFKVASEARDVIKTIIKSELDKRFPPERFGTVQKIDRDSGIVDVTLAGTGDQLVVPTSPSMQPRVVGDHVRISGKAGSYRIVDILNQGGYNISVDPVLDQANADLDELNTVTLPQLQLDLDAANAELDELNTVTLPQLQADLDAAEADLLNLNTVELPQLQADLDAANLEIDQRSRVLTQSTRPTVTATDRIYWMNTADDYKTEYWNGSTWTVVTYGTSSIAAGSVITSHMSAGTIDADRLVAGSITTDRMTANTISGDRITVNTLNADRIVAGSITTDRMTANTINGDRIIANTLHAGKIIAGTITTDRMTANTINGDRIAVNTLHADKIVSNTITAAKIAANTITAAEIAANTITATQIAGNTITGNEIAANTITTQELSVGGFDNLVNDPKFTQPLGKAWQNQSWNEIYVGMDRAGTGNAMRIFMDPAAGQEFVYNLPLDNIQVEPGSAYRVNTFFQVRGTGTCPANGVRIVVRWKREDGTFAASSVISNSTSFNPSTTWRNLAEDDSNKGLVTAPANAVSLSIYLSKNYDATGSWVVFSDPSITRAAEGKLIVDGAIDGKTITGALFKTSASGTKRIEISAGSTGFGDIRFYDAPDVHVGSIRNHASGITFENDSTPGGCRVSLDDDGDVSLSAVHGRDAWIFAGGGSSGGTITMTCKTATASGEFTFQSPLHANRLFSDTWATTGAAANTFMSSVGELAKSTSSRRYKTDITDELGFTSEQFLALTPHLFRHIEDASGREWHIGFVTEEAEELGLTHFVDYDHIGRPDGFQYAMWTAALQHIVRDQQAKINNHQSKINDLTARLTTLEGT